MVQRKHRVLGPGDPWFASEARHPPLASCFLSLRVLSSVPRVERGSPYHLHPHPLEPRLVLEPLEVESVVEERGHGFPLVPRERPYLGYDVVRERDRSRGGGVLRGRRGDNLERSTAAVSVVARIDDAGGCCSQTRRGITAALPLGGPYREGVVDGRIEYKIEIHTRCSLLYYGREERVVK